jgi:hypothetical protein
MLPGDFRGTVRAPRIHDHNLVRNFRKRSQRTRQVFLFIQRNDADGKAIHRKNGSKGVLRQYLTSCRGAKVTTACGVGAT